ncbi:MAG: conjugal transfer protein TraD [Sphingobacteriia bacterium]|nr:conjugal transfer protein TraD [Sphingobacteriia bacterium]
MLRRIQIIIKEQRKLKYQLSADSITKRKQDTRNKIEMGGLVIKAGIDYLHQEDKEILLGALVYISHLLNDENDGETYKEVFKNLGKEAFLNGS